MQWKEIQLPAQKLGLQLHSMEVSSADKYQTAFEEAIKVGSAALVVGGSALECESKIDRGTGRKTSAAGNLPSSR
ncbi:MAG: hypothetical protein ACREQV_03115, partial [Candidatus Binatia bacterium]